MDRWIAAPAYDRPMTVTAPARRADQLRAAIDPFLRFFNGPLAELTLDPDVANFAVGNPHEFAMPGYVGALREAIEPRDKDWFAYKLSEPEPRRVAATTMSAVTG